MKVCIFGTGAIGTHVAARLTAAGGSEVSVIARGAQLDAIRASGVTLLAQGREIKGRPAAATDDPATLPPQDLVIVTLKATALPGAAAHIAGLLAPAGCAIFALNGIPFWWSEGLPGNGGALPLLDPAGDLWHRLRRRAVGCVVSSSNEIRAPGVAFNSGGRHLALGEPDGSASPRLGDAADLLSQAGFEVATTSDIRREIWRKLCMNVAANPISALTRLTQTEWRGLPDLYALASQVVTEVLELAAHLGWDLRGELSAPGVLGPPAPPRPGGFRSSMLQDVLLGRPLEVEAILGQPVAFARQAGVPAPAMQSILAMLHGLDFSFRRESGRP
jgi:2-dehydropantoate 2-reductase